MATVRHKDWYKIEKIPDINYVMVYHIVPNYGRRVAEVGASDKLKDILWVVEDGTAYLTYVRSQLNAVEKDILDRSVKDPKWLADQNKNVKVHAGDYLKFAKRASKLNLKKLSDKKLLKNMHQLLRLQVRSHGYGQVTTWLIESDRQLFSGHLLCHLSQIINRRKLDLDPVRIFPALTTPLRPSFVEIENQESLKLAEMISRDKSAAKIFKKSDLDDIEFKLKAKNSKLLNKLRKHQQKWFWLHYNYRGPVLELPYFLQIWQGLVRENKIRQHIKESKNKIAVARKEQREILKTLKLDAKYEKLIRQAADIIWLKAYRKDCMYFGAYAMNRLLQELANRLHIGFNQVEFMIEDEYDKALLAGEFNVKELNQRRKFSVIYGNWDKVRIFLPPEAGRFLKSQKFVEDTRPDIDQLAGQIACPGKAKGRVRIIETVKDLPKMKKGDIMVSETTYPALVPAMKLASAIVTNVGGLTCHAAIVSRELKIPCIVGTKLASKVFKDGDRVEVDANNGIIRKLS